MERDSIEVLRERHKALAVDLVKNWAGVVLDNYVERQRAGVPKGEQIGISKKKMAAALYSTGPFSLREIAELAGSTEGSVKVWRTQEGFRGACENACKWLGELITNTLEAAMSSDLCDTKPTGHIIRELGGFNIADSPLDLGGLVIDLLPFFNVFATELVVKLIREKTQIPPGNVFNDSSAYLEHSRYLGLMGRALQSAHVFDMASRRKFAKDMLEVTKAQITLDLDCLTTPEAWTPANTAKSLALAESLKSMIFQQLDILARRN
jgi:hypothetical protein